ncbi:hypothetical protein F5B21DRAFT_492626 [Xylaria acuta]|nr:hypothetical protein F5B21DRAFT_492626 [Xylaria acuta]
MTQQPSLAPFGLRDFPTNIKPPITSNSVTHFDRETVKKDVESTRIVVHGRFPRLVRRFLAHKRRHGSGAERALYHAGWTWQQQVARLVEKRALVFLGRDDFTVLRSGKQIGGAYREWDRVGTEEEERSNRHLFLGDYLSYDEIMLSSLIGVSSPSFFINDGRRDNMGRPDRTGEFEPRGVIVGLVGARFERDDRMDSAYVLKSFRDARQHPELRDIFFEFFGRRKNPAVNFDADMYKARIRITADILFVEASRRARDVGKKAYVYVVGLGLGVWAVDPNQTQLYVQAFLASLADLGDGLSHIGTVEFAYIHEVLGFRSRSFALGPSKTVVDVRFSRRNPAAKLRGVDANHLLVLSYAWDGNAFPGNEYWVGLLAATGDPAAACMSTIGELHNPMINPGLLNGIEVPPPPVASG